MLITLTFEDQSPDDMVTFGRMMKAQQMHESIERIKDHIKYKLKREELSEEIYNAFDKFQDILFNELLTVDTSEL